MTRLPAHEALSRWAYPMGAPPVPSDEDMANARRFFDEQAAAHGHPRAGEWSERERGWSVCRLAMLEMAKRLSADKAIRDAVEQDEERKVA